MLWCAMLLCAALYQTVQMTQIYRFLSGIPLSRSVTQQERNSRKARLLSEFQTNVFTTEAHVLCALNLGTCCFLNTCLSLLVCNNNLQLVSRYTHITQFTRFIGLTVPSIKHVNDRLLIHVRGGLEFEF